MSSVYSLPDVLVQDHDDMIVSHVRVYVALICILTDGVEPPLVRAT